MWVDRQGVSTPIPIPSGAIMPRLSPDGKRLAYAAPRQFRDEDLWIYDFNRQTSTRLTFQGNNVFPVWAPDSKSLVFTTLTSGVLNLARIPADGSGLPERVLTSQSNQWPSSWSPTGNVVAFLETHEGINQISMLSMDGGREAKPFLQSRFPLAYPEFSPDGRCLAYASAESGATEVYVQPYPRWTVENRQFVDSAKPAISRWPRPVSSTSSPRRSANRSGASSASFVVRI